MKSRIIKIVHNAPWFDSECVSLRKLHRKTEKQYRKTGLVVHRESYVSLRKQTTEVALKKKCEYYGKKLDVANIRTLDKTINLLLDKKQDIVLPDTKPRKELANSFMSYFTENIEKI